MLTAKDGDLDEAEALDTGADDYLRKPFSFAVLVARVHALLRRASPGRSRAPRGRRPGARPARPPGAAGRRAGSADRPGVRRCSTFLVRRAGRVVTKQEILAGVWDDAFEGDPNVVEVYVARLRRKLERDGPRSIETVRGMGYRFADR